MQLLKLQEDTKKQIQKIYKCISYHSLHQHIPKTENYNLEYQGLGDRILSQYYQANDKRCNELCDIAMGMSIVDTIGKVCTELHVPRARPAKYMRINLSNGRREAYKRKGRVRGEKKRKTNDV